MTKEELNELESIEKSMLERLDRLEADVERLNFILMDNDISGNNVSNDKIFRSMLEQIGM